jgi:DNA-binding transcriptional ArsR family regulator
MAIFEALAEPHRRAILTMLLEGERPVGELVDELDLAQPTVSKHLKSLRDAGLVGVRADGNRRWYRLEPAPLAALDDWLTPFRRRWADRLDALERHLDGDLDPDRDLERDLDGDLDPDRDLERQLDGHVDLDRHLDLRTTEPGVHER